MKNPPNIQNIPIRTEAGRKIRKAFVESLPACQADFAELELRVVAASSEHIVKQLAKLLPASREWMVNKGYITQDGEALQLTPAGYAYFIKIYNGPLGVR